MQMNYIFDLDNTLIYSDAANNLAYKEAVRNVVNGDLRIDGGRITRGDIAARFPKLSVAQLSKIIAAKESLYPQYFDRTLLNPALLSILKQLAANQKRTILLTYGGKNRALQLLEYYGIGKYFSEKYFKEDFSTMSKYKFATDVLELNSRKIVLFENETEGQREAVSDGFSVHNIIKIV